MLCFVLVLCLSVFLPTSAHAKDVLQSLPLHPRGFGKNILNVAGMRSSPFLSLIKLFLLWISRTLVRGSCPVPSLPRSDWVPRSVRELTLAFLRRLVLLLARGGAGALDSGSTSLGSVRTVLVLSLLNRLVLFLLDLVGPKNFLPQ